MNKDKRIHANIHTYMYVYSYEVFKKYMNMHVTKTMYGFQTFGPQSKHILLQFSMDLFKCFPAYVCVYYQKS